MEHIKSEKKLYQLIGNYLYNNKYKVAYEVSVGKFHPRKIDIVGINHKKVVSVEVKLNNFNKTFQQAYTRLFYSDNVLMAFPKKYADYVNKKYINILNNYGIGLLSINSNVNEIIAPKKSQLLIPHRKERLIDNFNLKLKSKNGEDVY